MTSARADARAVATAAFLLASSACGDPALGSGTGQAWDSAGIRIIELAAVGGIPERELTFESAWGPTRDLLLGDPVYLDVTPDGRVILLDPMNTRVIVLSAAGEVEATFGRPGEGPGEFSGFLSGIVAADSILMVADLDLQHLIRFSMGGRVLGSRRLVGSGPAGRGVYGRDWRGHPSGGVAFRELTESGDVLMRWDGDVVETLHVVPFPDRAAGGSLLVPSALWDVDASGRVVVARSDRYRIEAWTASSTSPEWVAVREVGEPGLTDADREHLTAVLLEAEGWEAMPTDHAARLLAGIEFPDRAPVLAGLFLAPDGAIWVQHALPVLEMGRAALQVGTTDGIGARRWDVLTPEGLLRETLLLPEGFSPRRLANGWLYGVRTDALGVSAVARVSVER